jgi:predicted GH43/DUF377 family glycosyl hydrolase
MIPTVERFAENPLISPARTKPSREGWEVVGTFNAGAIRCQDEVLLLVRVAERPVHDDPDVLISPFLDGTRGSPQMKVLRVPRDEPGLVVTDPRWFIHQGQTYLTSISHLRVARSADGRHFTLEDRPALQSATWYESFGVEDPRITPLEGRYVIAYTAVCEHGIATALAETMDFQSFTRHGLIFAPENRDVTIFPEKIGSRYVCHHRAVARHIGGFDMWAAYAYDLRYWGQHARLMSPRPGFWDSARIGGGAVPIRTDRGWLAIYHGVDDELHYGLGAVLCDLERPEHALARSAEPLMRPEAEYETVGFFENVVFTCGATCAGDTLTIYYGAADQYTCGAQCSVQEVLESLEEV